MTNYEMKEAGRLLCNVKWTDEELSLAIKGLQNTFSFLQGARAMSGGWILASLRGELSRFERMSEARKP